MKQTTFHNNLIFILLWNLSPQSSDLFENRHKWKWIDTSQMSTVAITVEILLFDHTVLQCASFFSLRHLALMKIPNCISFKLKISISNQTNMKFLLYMSVNAPSIWVVFFSKGDAFISIFNFQMVLTWSTRYLRSKISIIVTSPLISTNWPEDALEISIECSFRHFRLNEQTPRDKEGG